MSSEAGARVTNRESETQDVKERPTGTQSPWQGLHSAGWLPGCQTTESPARREQQRQAAPQNAGQPQDGPGTWAGLPDALL